MSHEDDKFSRLGFARLGAAAALTVRGGIPSTFVGFLLP
jgi:hypothetical protein